MKKLGIILILLIIFPLCGKCMYINKPSFNKVSLAFAGEGPGTGIMGHTFILFYNEFETLSESLSYSYSVSVEESLQYNVPKIINSTIGFLGYGKIFYIEKLPGLLKINSYLNENRYVLLYDLNLDSQQIINLQQDLEKKMYIRNNNKIRDYNFIQKNCYTEAVTSINNVLYPNQERLEASSFKSEILMTFKNLFFFGDNIRNAPKIASYKISSNTLVVNKHIIPPIFIRKIPLYIKFFELVEKFDIKTKKKGEFLNFTKKIISKSDIIFYTYLDLIENIISHLANEEGVIILYKEILQVLMLMVNTDDYDALISLNKHYTNLNQLDKK